MTRVTIKIALLISYMESPNLVDICQRSCLKGACFLAARKEFITQNVSVKEKKVTISMSTSRHPCQISDPVTR